MEEGTVLQDSNQIVKTDMTLLVIQTRGYMGLLFRQLARADGNETSAYSRCVEMFFQLYLAFKYNADISGKIGDWEEKKKIYDDLFYGRIMAKHEFIPEILVKNFDLFLEDVIKSGIYNLTETEYGDRYG